jgi:hypothetical protein
MTEIDKYSPCEEALAFRNQYPSFKEAWIACPRGDWMLWIAKKLDVDLKTLTKAKAKCALTVVHLMRDQRSINACEVALKFSDGLATREELNNAAYAADAAYASAASAASDAAYASAASDAAAAYAAAAYAADAAAADAAAAYAADAHTKNRQQTADLCREILTESVFSILGIK